VKILIASDTYYPDVNGAAYFSYRLATLLAKRGHDVSVICPSQSFRNHIFMQEGVRVIGIASLPIPFYPNIRFCPPWIARRAIRKFLSNGGADVIHIQNHFLLTKAVFQVAHKLGIPMMGTNHMMMENVAHHLLLSAQSEEKVATYLWSRFVHIYEQMVFVTAPTATAAAHTQKVGLGKEIIPISCGIDLRRFSPGIGASELRQKYEIPDRPILLYVGRLDTEKRVEVILRAMPEITRNTGAHLVVAGTGKLRRSLENLAANFGVEKRITFTGYMPDEDIAGIYRIADVFVTASVAELQSIVTMEAMASGLPVIAANAMALPELVHEGENGFLFPEDDSEALARAAVKILSDKQLRESMGRKSLEIIQAHDINQTVEQFESLYRRMLAPNVSAKTHSS
jgi:1,2-diacylglycerol 3-alpha-glucosyltransferase